MKSRPITFSAEMVRAILDGRKTQTRRIVKPQGIASSFQRQPDDKFRFTDEGSGLVFPCPYGQPGDELWVRETWGVSKCLSTDTATPHPEVPNAYIHFRAGGYVIGSNHGVGGLVHKWRSPRFMPRWASRLTLVVTSVRVERLQDISEHDAKAEGASCCLWHTPSSDESTHVNLSKSAIDVVHPGHGGADGISYRNGFATIWNSIHLDPKPIYRLGKIVAYECYPWSNEDFDAKYPGIRQSGVYRGKPLSVTANPWVWVIEFEVKA